MKAFLLCNKVTFGFGKNETKFFIITDEEVMSSFDCFNSTCLNIAFLTIKIILGLIHCYNTEKDVFFLNNHIYLL